MLESFIKGISDGHDLTSDEAGQAIRAMMTGQVAEDEMIRLLVALRDKGEAVSEVIGAARVMRELSNKIRAPLDSIDLCGTGGDAKGTFNFSTIAAFVVAGAGIPVAKHGNRSVSSQCGSADVLKACGVKIDPAPTVVERCLAQIGICFLFAPSYHPAMRHVAAARQKIGTRTLFNLLGPLTNPAGVQRQVVGVFLSQWLRPMGEALRVLGLERGAVVHGSDGLDEVTLTGPTEIVELKGDSLEAWRLDPADWGLSYCRPAALRGGDAEINATMLRGILEGSTGPVRDTVLLNAALAIAVARAGLDQPLDFGAALRTAAHAIDEGDALQKLKQLIALTHESSG